MRRLNNLGHGAWGIEILKLLFIEKFGLKPRPSRTAFGKIEFVEG